MASENTVVSTDPIFRPSDIAVAPDGSVFIADWQDPVVGGHNMLDFERGRIFRLAPISHRGSVPDLDLESDDGLLAAFGSPNQATRYRAYEELMLRGEDERRALLVRAWQGQSEPAKARALWMLSGLGRVGAAALEEAFPVERPAVSGACAARCLACTGRTTWGGCLSCPRIRTRRCGAKSH